MKQTITMSEQAAVDTNILVYLHDTIALDKREMAARILFQEPFIPAQVISEYLNVTRKLLPLTKERLLNQTALLLQQCVFLPTLASTLQLASQLIHSYRFQLFDSVIVAACLEADCPVLYSEDMQNGLVVNGSLTIVNPFL